MTGPRGDTERPARRRSTWVTTFALACLATAPEPVLAAAASPFDHATIARVQRQWTVDQGLPGNAVTALAEDDHGLIWIATLAGLARFDGVTVVVHDAARHPVLGSDRFTTMKRTPDGALWLSNEQYDLFRFADETFARIDGVSVLCVAQSPGGWLAYGTSRGILLIGPEGQRRLDPAISSERVLELDWPAPGRLLALTDTRLLEIDSPLGPRPRLTRSRPMPGPNSGALLQRDDGAVLVGSQAGLSRIDDWSGDATPLLRDDAVVALRSRDRRSVMVATRDRIGTLDGETVRWVGRNRDSLGEEPLQVRIGDDTATVLADSIELRGATLLHTPSRITDTLVDHEGNLWVATNASGLLQYHASPIRLLGSPEGLAGDNTYPILAAADDSLWVATLEGGLQHLVGADPRRWQRQALPFGVVWSLLRTRDGALWVGGDGVCVLRDADCERDGLPVELQQQTPTRAMHEDPRGRLWIVTVWGLWRRDGERWEALPTDQGTQPGRGARAFVDDGDARLWIATSGDGILEMRDGHRVRRIAAEQGLSSNVVRALWRDSVSGEIWAGTENRGLCRLRPDRQPLDVQCIGRPEGLPSSGIHAIRADASGRLWINSNQGLYGVERAELDAVFAQRGPLTRVQLFDAQSGLRSSEGNGGAAPAVTEDSRGRLWFPTQAGIAVIDPAAAMSAAGPVTVRVDIARNARQELHAPTRVSLPPPQRDIDLTLTADSYRDPEHVRFRYRFGGAEWRDIGTRRVVELTRLPVGEWTLELQARNAGGDWPEDATRLALSVLPAWHERASLRALGLLLTALAIVAAFVLRGRRLVARQQELETTVATRTRDLEIANRNTEAALDTVRRQHEELGRLHRSRTEFAANISHELKTPLTLLTAPLADHPAIAGVIGEPLYQAMRDSGQRMQRLLRQLADLHLIDSTGLLLQRRAVGVNGFVAECVQPFAALARQQGLEFRLDSDVDDGLAVDIDPLQFEKVLGNLLSNAIKFTPVPGSVAVRVGCVEHRVHLRVEDSGIGVPAPYRSAIFERFFQVDSSARRAHEGSGIGLALAREIVVLHGGTLDYVESSLSGAGFLVRLPRSSQPLPVAVEVEIPGASQANGGAIEDRAVTPTAADRSGERATVLVVEDQPALRTYLRQALSGRYDVLEAGNGQEGLDIARAVLPDVILTDVMMPGMDGVQMTGLLRADPATRCIPLIFLTALDGEQDRIAGLLAGGDHYLTKPFTAQVVQSQIAALLRARDWLVESLQTPAAAVLSRTASGDPPSLLERVEAIVRSRLGDDRFDLDALVHALATSRSQLHRRLQAEHGVSPGELITRTRLAAASELLGDRRGSVTEVCYSVGFRSLSSFSRAFKQRFGCNPGDWAQRREGSADR